MKHPESCSCINCEVEREETRAKSWKGWTCPYCHCANHLDLAICSNCQHGRIRYRRRRRRNPTWRNDHYARKFWELCMFSMLRAETPINYPQGYAARNADAALVAWRERWERPADPEHFGVPARFRWENSGTDPEVPEADHTVFPFTSDRNPEEEGGNDYAAPIAGNGPAILALQNLAAGKPTTHRFVPVTGNRYCGECGGGKLHEIHFPETKKAMEPKS